MPLRKHRNKPAAPPRRRRRIRKLRLLALMGVLAVLGIAAFSYGLVVAVGAQLNGLDPFHQPHQQVDGYIYAGDGHTILAVLRGSQSRVLVPSQDISPWMKQAIVATEDKRFWEHRGIDIRGMGRALWADIRHQGAVQGGSTITQQFVKNSLTGNERTITRKLKEAALAWQLEQRWSKDQILTAYLNTIYFGNGAYGIERAARTYFGHTAARLNLPEAALLAGIPEDPSLYDPVAHPVTAKARRTTVLRLMLAQGVIDTARYRWAVRQPMPKPQDVHLSGVQGVAPYFGEYVKAQLIDKLGAKRVFGGGYRVNTTIDLRLQALARTAIKKWLPSASGPQAALVAINPTTGAVLAMYGGNNFHASQFNLAVQGERQPGSSFKPFVLATALKQGISPQTTLVSKPISIFLGNKYWYVHNFEGEYLGPINIAQAITVSDNSVFSQLTKIVGPANVAQTARNLGITSPLQGYFAIGLGAEPVNPLEMARAYASFANGGYRVDGSFFGNEPRAITDDQDGVGRRRRHERARAEAGALLVGGRAADADAPERDHVGDREGGGAVRPGRRRQDGDDGELRRRVVRRLHAAARDRGLGRLPEQARADALRVPRPARRRRHVSGADLEVVHGVGARRDGRAAGVVREPAVSLGRREAGHVPRQQDRARQRALPRHVDDRLLHGPRPGADRGVQAERGRRAERRRVDAAVGGGAARGDAVDAAVDLQAGGCRPARRSRREAVPARRDALVVRQGDARARETAARSRPSRRRAQPAEGADASCGS